MSQISHQRRFVKYHCAFLPSSGVIVCYNEHGRDICGMDFSFDPSQRFIFVVTGSPWPPKAAIACIEAFANDLARNGDPSAVCVLEDQP